MHTPADTEERDIYLATAFETLVKVEKAIAEAEDREKRMTPVPVDGTRFPAMKENIR
jgi:hypothetical protein